MNTCMIKRRKASLRSQCYKQDLRNVTLLREWRQNLPRSVHYSVLYSTDSVHSLSQKAAVAYEDSKFTCPPSTISLSSLSYKKSAQQPAYRTSWRRGGSTSVQGEERATCADRGHNLPESFSKYNWFLSPTHKTSIKQFQSTVQSAWYVAIQGCSGD